MRILGKHTRINKEIIKNLLRGNNCKNCNAKYFLNGKCSHLRDKEPELGICSHWKIDELYYTRSKLWVKKNNT